MREWVPFVPVGPSGRLISLTGPRLVIDGQQRLTTLQILLRAAAAAAADHGAQVVADELLALTVNRSRAASGDFRLKVRPSRRDRFPFMTVMEKGKGSLDQHGILGAYGFFREVVEQWITDDGAASLENEEKRIEALQNCLDDLLYVVSINLDESDNAQVIFETLNARGTGLGALDLIKNATFLQAEREGAPAEKLYDRDWEPTFEADDYWIDELRQGRQKRPRADWFLMHWLATELSMVVRVDKLFEVFRKDILHVAEPPPMDILVPRVCDDARIMRSFDDFKPGTAEALFFSRLDAMDTTTLLPVALLLFRSKGLDPIRHSRAIRALESWLVRRAILRLTSKSYNRTLSSLLKAIKGNIERADEAVVTELRASQATTVLWPSDDDVRWRLTHEDLYGYVGQPRVRMLLEACELDIRDPAKTETIALPAELSIEHALPQSWEENWPVEDGPEASKAYNDRQAHVNRLGNLTLVTQPAQRLVVQCSMASRRYRQAQQER